MFSGYIFIFILGLCVGSFLNVLIDRLPEGKDIVFKRSHCDSCGKTLSVADLIPLFSYLFLSGRCRYCNKKISIQNPLVEFSSGVLFLFIFLYGLKEIPTVIFWSQLIYLLSVFSILVVIFVIDLKEKIISDSLLLILIGLVFIDRIIYFPNTLSIALLIGFVTSLFFLLLHLLTRGKGMGLGDVKYAFFMGFFLGWPTILVAFYTAFLTGAGVSLILVLTGRKKFKSRIAFGPFLVVATFVGYFFGEVLLSFWQGLLF